jgi:hypothetical protein
MMKEHEKGCPRLQFGDNMNESKHTPGPWHYRFRIEHDATGHTVREYYAVTSDHANSIVAELEALPDSKEWDARLIAAAPDLLAALMVLVDHAREAYPHFEDTRGQRDIGEALAAISKARGTE